MNSSFLTTLDTKYSFIELAPSQAPADINGSQVPVYLSPDNTPMNKFYQKIVGPVTVNSGPNDFLENPYTKDKFPFVFRPQLNPQLPMPNPKDFMSQTQYAAALSTWYRKWMIFFCSALLPTPISGVYYLPAPPKIFTKEEKTSPSRYRTFKPNLWPLLPKNYLHMVDVTLAKNTQIDPEKQFPDQIPKRDPILYKHHMTSTAQWVGQLVPVEPKPFLYDTFEEYEQAFINWASCTYKSLTIPPIPPKKMGSMISIETFTESEEEKSQNAQQKINVQKSSLIFKELPKADFSWVKNLETINISQNKVRLNSLSKQVIRPLKFETERLPLLEVFGIPDKDKFVSDMKDFGFHLPDPNLKTQVHPKNFSFGMYLQNFSAVESYFANPNNINLQFVLRILHTELSYEFYNKIFSKTVNNIKVASIIANIFNKDSFNLRQMFTLANCTLRHPIRLSYFLHALFIHDTASSQIFSIMFQESNISLLNKVVSYLNITSKYHMEIVPMIEKRGIIYLMRINQYYLVQCLLTLFKDYKGYKFYQTILDYSKQFFMNVSKILVDQGSIKELRNGAIGSEQYCATLMIVQSESNTLHRLLLGSNFPLWLSENPPRKNLIATIMHSSAITAAAYLFLKYCPEHAKSIESFSPNVCSFIAYICRFLNRYSEELHITFKGQTILPFLEAIVKSKSKYVNAMLVPFASILSSDQIISNFRATDFRPLLVNVICRLCSSFVNTTDFTFKDKMVALTIFASQKDPCFAMSQVPNFAEVIVDHLVDNNFQILQQDWEFFKKFAHDPKIIDQIFKRQRITSALTEIFRSNNKIAHKKFYKFSTNLWTNPDPVYIPLKKSLCDIILPVIGTLVCNFMTRNTLYKEDEKSKIRIEKFFQAIDGLSALPLCQDFTQTVARHMNDSDSVSSKSKRGSSIYNF